MINTAQHDRATTDLHNAIIDELLSPLAASLYRVAANLVTAETGKLPTLFAIERKGGELAQALGNLLSFASENRFYTLQNARYAEDFFAGQCSVQKQPAPAYRQVNEQIDLSDVAAEIEALLDLDADGEVSPPLPPPPKRRRCKREDCNRTFKPHNRKHIFCSDSCKAVVNTRKRRAAEKARAKAS